MSKTTTILAADSGRVHFVAQGLLCGLAAVCTVGVIWALGHRPGSRPAPGLLSVEPVLSPGPTANPVRHSALQPASLRMPSHDPALELLAPPPPAFEPAGIAKNVPAFAALMPAPATAPAMFSGTPAVPAARRLKNPQIIETVEAARQARRLGDMMAALESLRAADLREPQHPEILGEMGLTYEAMGLHEKARAAWRAVQAMGETEAGGYHTLATSKLEGAVTEAFPPANHAVSLGACQVRREPQKAGAGERVTVRVPILAVPGAVIDPSQMDIHVFLFEQINDGERIEQVRAEEPLQNWISEPVDWSDANGETLDITYDLTAPTPEELRNIGQRKFHGYIVKLFYQNQLVGEQAQPPNLHNFPPRNGPSGPDSALFPK